MKIDLVAFRRLAPAAQLAQLRGQKVEREFTVERDGLDKEKRTVWLSIASEDVYSRWWGEEILNCKKGSIREKRLKSGMPLLVGHDTSDQVGVVEDYEISPDRKLRVLARFGRSARAEEIWQDVLDGIRRNTSVGYIIHDLEFEKSEEGVDTYRVTDWEPLEGSLVPVPADPTVGIGRAFKQPLKKGQTMDDEKAVPAGDAVAAERFRISSLLAAGNEYRDLGGATIAARLINDPAATVETFKTMMMVAINARGSKPTHTAEPFQEPSAFGDGAREILPMPKYFTGEGAQEKAYRAGMWFRAYVGQCIPRYRSERAERFVRDHGLNRGMGEGVLSTGGALVPYELSPAIIDLAEKYGVFRQNADVYRMKSDTLNVPKSTSDPTASFVSENGELPETDGAWGSVGLYAKKIGTIVRVSTELVEDSVIDIADRLAFQLGRAFAKKEDECGFVGDGTSTYGGMQGIFTKLADSAYAGSKVTAATNHDLFTEIDATDLSNLMAALPEDAHEGAKFYCSQVAWSLVFWRLMAAASGNSISDLSASVQKMYAGYPVVTSPTLPAGAATDYTALTMIGFGNLRLASKFGARRDIRIQILTETYAASDQIGVMGTERFHVVNHGCGDTTTAGPIVGLVGA